MTKFSIVFTIDRYNSRQEFLNWAKKRYGEMFPEAEIVIGVDDSSSEYFCKARAVNNGVLQAQNDIIVLMDTDMVFTKKQILNGLAALSEYQLVSVYNRYYRLKPNISKQILSGDMCVDNGLHPKDEDIDEFIDRRVLVDKYLNGGIQIFYKDTFLKVGGYNESFVGWGGEDTAFNIAVNTLCGRMVALDDEAFHLWHPRQPSYANYSTGKNKQLLIKYRENLNKSHVISQLHSKKKIDCHALHPHYLDHLVDLWNMIPAVYKGDFYIGSTINSSINTSPMLDKCGKFGIEAKLATDMKSSNNYLLVAGIQHEIINLDRELILLIHGAGQSFKADSGKRYGVAGDNRHKVRLFLNTNNYTNALNRKIYPGASSVIVGCPKMDKWHKRTLAGEIKNRENPPVIAISFHFDLMLCPETRSTFPYYQNSLSALSYKNISGEWKVLGHGHPRMIETLIPHYEHHGIEVARDFDTVMEKADLYICDHMSTLYEFASTNRPVVVLNAPWYRKDVEHGARFWEHADVGFNVDHPDELLKAIDRALEDPLEQKMLREKACNATYAFRDGMCTERAANAIIDFLNSDETPKKPSSKQKYTGKKWSKQQEAEAMYRKWEQRRGLNVKKK